MTSTQMMMCLYLVSSSTDVFYVLLYVSKWAGAWAEPPQSLARAVNEDPT